VVRFVRDSGAVFSYSELIGMELTRFNRVVLELEILRSIDRRAEVEAENQERVNRQIGKR